MKRPVYRRRQPVLAVLFAITIVVAFVFGTMPSQASPAPGASTEGITETIAAAPAALTILALGLTMGATALLVTSARIKKLFFGQPANRAGSVGTFQMAVSKDAKTTRTVTSQLISTAARVARRRPRGYTPIMSGGSPPGVVMNC